MQVQPDGDKPYDDINITPMLDLAYVLLIIFIIMTTATVQGMKVNLPQGQRDARAWPSRRRRRSPSPADGRIFLDTVPVSWPSCETRLVADEARRRIFPWWCRAMARPRTRPS